MFNFTEQIDDLKLSVDFDTKKEIINEIKFSGPHCIQYKNLISTLEFHIKNISLDKIISILNEQPELKTHFPSLPFLLFERWFKNIKAIVTIPNSQEFICNCSGLTKKELAVFLHREIPPTYGEIVAQTKASIACGSCTLTLKTEYRRTYKKLFSGKLNKSFFNELGDWISHKNLTPAEIILGVDDLKNEWCQLNNLKNSTIEIIKAEGLHFTVKINDNLDDLVKMLDELEQFLFTRSGLLIILIY